MIQAGILRHVIKIQKLVEAEQQDSFGQMTQKYYTIYDNVRAAIVPLSGREYIVAQQIAAEINTRITIRRYENVDETCRILRILDNDSPPTIEVYDIAAPPLPDPVSGMRYLNLMCIRRTADGWRKGEDAIEYRVDNPDLKVDDPNWGVDSA